VGKLLDATNVRRVFRQALEDAGVINGVPTHVPTHVPAHVPAHVP
jgi:hypothetical protein